MEIYKRDSEDAVMKFDSYIDRIGREGVCAADIIEELTVGTKMIADPEKCFQELNSEELQILLPCLELIIVWCLPMEPFNEINSGVLRRGSGN